MKTYQGVVVTTYQQVMVVQANTPEEAIENARDAARDYEAQFSTAPITDDFAADIEENGFLGGHDGFRFNERGQLVRA